MFKKLIVGMDFSALGEKAARTAVALAAGLGAEVVLVHVVASQGRGKNLEDAGASLAEVRPGIEQQLKETCARFAAGGARIDWGVVDGDPAEQLATFAERWNGDLLVAGSHGRPAVSQMLLGSVADKLVKIARVPVVVVGPNAT